MVDEFPVALDRCVYRLIREDDIWIDASLSESLIWHDMRGAVCEESRQTALWRAVEEHRLATFLKWLGRARLRPAASILQRQGQAFIALRIIEQHLQMVPNDPSGLSVLCAALRQLGRAQEAIDRTDLRWHSNAALATSRAAAWCDLGHPAVARIEADRAMAILEGDASEELMAIYRRINSLGG